MMLRITPELYEVCITDKDATELSHHTSQDYWSCTEVGTFFIRFKSLILGLCYS